MSETNEHESEDQPSFEFPIVGKKEKAHSRGIVGVFTYDIGEHGYGLISIGHDSLKVWKVDTDESGATNFSFNHEISKWRCGVQSCDATADGRCVSIIGLDSILYEVIIGESGPVVTAYDLGYMETWHIRIARNKINYMTTSFSGFISEVNMSGEFSRREAVNHVKQISVISYSNDNRLLAVGNLEGVVRTYEVSTFKNLNSYEIHAMKIRAIVFLPDDDKFLTASDDKTLKLFSLTTGSTIHTYCGCSSPISCVALELNKFDGRFFATGCVNGDVLFWTTSIVVPLCSISTQHEGGVWSMAFSPDGRNLLTAGEDKRIICYNVPDMDLPTESLNTLRPIDAPVDDDAEMSVDNPAFKEVYVKRDIHDDYEAEHSVKPAIREQVDTNHDDEADYHGLMKPQIDPVQPYDIDKVEMDTNS
ncbi:unnamed protein product [Auanema sp. JU1783]|nr:unnamed protein product [Auanema sp. JU1783]